ncbi:MAG: Asp/Glu racemase [Proteobacteria bacterium]|nr:Asp/Glu racemase [Pseudomonadota bacterium]
METEIPALLRAREQVLPERFTFHSSRMRMKNVSMDELASMDAESDRCALELSDARVDVMGYACLVAIMSMGKGYHRESEARLFEITKQNDSPCPIVSSAGALIEGLHVLKAKKISMITPYMKPLTKLVVDYIEDEGIEVVDALSLEISDNQEVAAQDSRRPASLFKQLNVKDVDAVVISACVQMPSLASVPIVEALSGLPVVSTSICTTFRMLRELGLATVAPGGGTLLSGHLDAGLKVA